jgi:hypothetical protein
MDVLGSGSGQFPTFAQVWLNDGHGNFTAGSQLAAQAAGLEEFTLADLNGDGYDDAIVVSRGAIAIYLNNGTGDGSFGQPFVYSSNDLAYFPLYTDGAIRVGAGKTASGQWYVAVSGPNNPSWALLYTVNSDGTLAPKPQPLLVGQGYPPLNSSSSM